MNNAQSNRWVGWLASAALVAVVAGGWVLAAGRHDYIGRAVSSPLFIKCGLIAAGCVIALIGLITMVARIGRPARQARSTGLAAGNDGTAIVEFALVFPIALTVVLILTQAMLMMAGAIVVNYAAYAAARSAIVWVPQDLPDLGNWMAEGENHVVDPSLSQKCYRIKMSAVVACLPVAGLSDEPDPSNGAVHDGIAQYYQSFPGTFQPNWVNNFVTKKMGYSWNHTTTTLQAGVQPNIYDPAEDLTVEVVHEFKLAIPFADRIFQNGYLPGLGYTTTIRAKCTLNNEGVSDTIQEDNFGGPAVPAP